MTSTVTGREGSDVPGRRPDHRRQRGLRRAAAISWATAASCCSARPPTARTSSTGNERASRSGSSTRRASTPSPSRPTGPTPTASTATSWASRPTTRTPTPRWPTSVASRRGCGATVTSSASSSGSGPATTPTRHQQTKARFYGLDLYSLRASMEAVVGYLDSRRPRAARAARERYSCFDHVGAEGPAYGYVVALDLRRAVRERGRRRSWSICGGGPTPDPGAVTDGSPRTSSSSPSRTRGSSATPRSTTGRCTGPRSRRGTCATATWPARSTRSSPISTTSSAAPKVVVWEHNSHVGDARATEMGARAASSTSASSCAALRPRLPAGRFHHPRRPSHRRLRLGRPGRTQARAARAGRQLRSSSSTRPSADQFCPAPRRRRHAEALRDPRLERAIGVIYRPADRAGRATGSTLGSPDQFDAVIHVDRTTRGRAARTDDVVGRRRATRDLPDRPLGGPLRNRRSLRWQSETQTSVAWA